MVVGEAEGANQSEALILGGGGTVADDEGASYEARMEDVVASGARGAVGLTKLNWPHPRHSYY